MTAEPDLAALMVVDAKQKTRALRGLAHEYTDNDDPWLAIHAHLAADLAAVRLVWTTATPEQWTGFTAAAADHLAQLEFPAPPGEALALARGVLAAYLPPDVVQDWIASLDPAAELTLQGYPHGAKILADVRLSGDTIEAFRDRKANECAVTAARVNKVMVDEEMWNAVELMYAADMAAYESWLAERAMLAGDDLLITLELRWMLTVGALSALKHMPEDFSKAVGVVRSRLAWAVGPSLATDLASRFAPLPK